MPNYGFPMKRQLPEIKDGHVFRASNFHQLKPHTKIFEGRKGLIFERCNVINCDLPADTKLINSNNSQIEYCSNRHPEWIEKGLEKCPEDCSHVADVDEIQEDGVTVQKIYHYADRSVE